MKQLFEVRSMPVHAEEEITPRGAHFLGAVQCAAGWVDLYSRRMPSGQRCYHAQLGDKLVTITDAQFEIMRTLPLNEVACLLWFCWRRDTLRERYTTEGRS